MKQGWKDSGASYAFSESILASLALMAVINIVSNYIEDYFSRRI